MMTYILAARFQTVFSLGFHMIFGSIGMVMPFLKATAHLVLAQNEKKIYFGLTKS
jgi:cytochrome bd-type quinol oxidase subunit 1